MVERGDERLVEASQGDKPKLIVPGSPLARQ